MTTKALFEIIQSRLTANITLDFIKSIRTVKGNTQNSEREVIKKIKEVLMEMEYGKMKVLI
jgi:signal transduction histidine kinase